MSKNDCRNNDTLVVLIHGFCRRAKDMQFWKKCLQEDFPHILTPDLPASYSSFEDCVKILTDKIAEAQAEKYKHLYIAGHSMGGLMAREYLAANKPSNAGKLICVGTPHYGSRLADIALCIPGAGKIWKPLHALKCSARTHLTTPQIPDLQTALIVSTNNSGFIPGKLFLSKDSDGLVEKSSVLTGDASFIAETKANHIQMQFDMETALLIRKFFLEGTF